MKKTLIVLGALILIGAMLLVVVKSTTQVTNTTPDVQVSEVTANPGVASTTEAANQAPQEELLPPVGDTKTTIGTSANGQSITAYHYGSGEKEILFIGGLHGGYSWNTPLVAYELMNYLEENLSRIPDSVRVTVIPVMNPDGLMKVAGTLVDYTKDNIPTGMNATVPGRFNGNTVDLNRNFDCEWQATGTWQNRSVSGGSAPFSEPETAALRDYVSTHAPTAVVVWYSAAGGVYSSNCKNGVLPETKTITSIYAKASGYPAYETFDYYAITGDAVNWFAKIGIPAISVLLSDHENTEWEKNRKGVEALLKHYGDEN